MPAAELDETDRQIAAALIRDGRASWRAIAEVLGQQERTVARRGKRLFATGAVRIHALANPSVLNDADAYLLRVDARPADVRAIGRWLAEREQTLWVSALAGSSSCVAEIFLPRGTLGATLYDDVAGLEGVRDVALRPLVRHHRTVSGWRPDVLSAEQYLALSPDEDASRATLRPPGGEPLDEGNRALVDLLRRHGRATLEELAAGTGLAKATVSRRLDGLTASGALFIRAVLDPATLGYPVEALVELECRIGALDDVGRAVAELPSTRWAASTGERIVVQSALAGVTDLERTLARLGGLDGVTAVRSSLYAEIFKRSSTVYVDGVLPPAVSA
ncbi:hypothetical protein GCM10011512_17020 [Tersicoccus solisilvae]|uniref:HTH asnC-type domain-containing protein n=1 Tax=Tersicoccus solisilvae TaxID=1882339 RepID=A0ABQ1P4G9_9MICC|nr:Lrp/AsnC family transcriptional regulator [Tersicoccus solisilvae]GGC90612.1 hypothetical protein GCM10011512_17020 [Tersicoccus solisilvae]